MYMRKVPLPSGNVNTYPTTWPRQPMSGRSAKQMRLEIPCERISLFVNIYKKELILEYLAAGRHRWRKLQFSRSKLLAYCESPLKNQLVNEHKYDALSASASDINSSLIPAVGRPRIHKYS